MASGIFYPAINRDDGDVNYNDTYSYFATDITLGSWGGYFNDWIRFQNVNIPQGVTITEAYVKLTAIQSDSGTDCNVNCYFNDVDDAIAPLDTAEYNALALTGAVVWNGLSAWTDGNQYDTPSLVSILQNIIDRAGFSSGNAVQLLIKNNASSTNAYRRMSSFDKLSGAEKAELHVTWIADTNITAEPLNAISSLSAVPQVQLNLTNNPFQVVSSLEVADIYRGRFIVAEEFNSTATLNSTVQIKLLPQPFEAAASLVSSLQLGINALPFEAASELLSGLFVGKTLAAEEFTANSELAGNTQVQLVPPSVSAVSSLSSDILFGLSVTDFEGVSSLDSIVTLLHRSSLTLINGIRFGSDLSLINSLNLDINSQLVLVNDILTGLTGDLILKMDINELAKLNDALTLINNINDENSGVSQGPFYFLKSHGL